MCECDDDEGRAKSVFERSRARSNTEDRKLGISRLFFGCRCYSTRYLIHICCLIIVESTFDCLSLQA